MKFCVPIILFILVCGNAMAQNPDSASGKKIAPWFVERFKVTAGFFRPVNNTSIQVGITGGSGTKVDFESDLGFATKVGTFFGSAQWRITRRSRINFANYKIDRSSTTTLQKDITFQNTTYNLNASVNSFFNTSILQISYGYAILAKPRYELGLLIGTHLVGGKAGISLNSGSGSISNSKDFGFTAPLPDLGIWGGYAFTDRLAFNFETVYLAVTVGDVKGKIATYNFSFTYRLISKLDLSLGYTGLNFDVKAKGTNATGEFIWGYNGPSLSASYSFGKRYWGH